MTRRARPWVVAVSLYGVLAIAMVGPGLAPGRTLSSSDELWYSAPWTSLRPDGVPGLGSNRELHDQVRVFQPFLQHTRATLPHIPLWNPSVMGGRPFIGNAQSAVFSPFSVPSYVLPFWKSLAVAAALKLFVAALGGFGLARALGMRSAGALLAGLVYGFSLWTVAWLSWPMASVWVWLPWLWLMAERVVRRPDALAVAGLAAVVGVQFLGGHPESSFHIVAATCAFLAIRLGVLRPAEGPRLPWAARRVGVFAAGGLLGTALAALTLLPLVELIAHSGDVEARSSLGAAESSPRYLLGTFLHNWWGRPTRTSLELGHLLAGHAFYLGAVSLMLGAAALVRPTAERIGVAVLGVLAMAVAFGLPLVADAVRALPGFHVAQNTRLPVVFVLCGALLAGWGLDDLMDPERARSRRRAVAGLALALLAAPLVWVVLAGDRPALSLLGDGLRIAWGFAEPPAAGLGGAASAKVAATLHWSSLLEWLVLGGAALVLVALRLAGRLGPVAFAAAAVVLVTADLFKAGMGLNPAIPVDHAVQPVTPALRLLQARRPNRFAGLTQTAPFSIAPPIPPDVAMRYGLSDARGYDFPVEERFLRLWRSQIAPGCSILFCTTQASATPKALRVLSLLSVSELLQQPQDEVVRAPSLRVEYDGPDGRVYHNSAALPRAFVVDRQVVVHGGDEALRAVTASGFRARDAVVAERQLPGVRLLGATTTSGASGVARIEREEPERVVIRATSGRRGVLVLTDVAYPGWKAKVDGRDVSIARVNYLLRGVPLTAGAHRVELRYVPVSWRIGWLTTLVALLILGGLVVVGARGRRRAAAGLVRPP